MCLITDDQGQHAPTRASAGKPNAAASVATAATRTLRQAEMGHQLAEPLGDGEQSWLDADLQKAPA